MHWTCGALRICASQRGVASPLATQRSLTCTETRYTGRQKTSNAKTNVETHPVVSTCLSPDTGLSSAGQCCGQRCPAIHEHAIWLGAVRCELTYYDPLMTTTHGKLSPPKHTTRSLHRRARTLQPHAFSYNEAWVHKSHNTRCEFLLFWSVWLVSGHFDGTTSNACGLAWNTNVCGQR